MRGILALWMDTKLSSRRVIRDGDEDFAVGHRARRRSSKPTCVSDRNSSLSTHAGHPFRLARSARTTRDAERKPPTDRSLLTMTITFEDDGGGKK